MVASQALHAAEVPLPIEPVEMPEEDLRWCSVTLNEVLERGSRLEASVFDIEGKHAREVLKRCKWAILHITGENGLATSFYPTRFKRILVDNSEYPLILPSQIQEINPTPKGYLSSLCDTDFDLLKAKTGQILLTRSGTIGNCSLVGETLHGKTLSDDIIRITCKNEEDTGYLYAFVRTKIGNALIRTNEYGAVVSHIEPEHLESVPIPDPPPVLKKRIHDLVIRSYALRDESNALLEKAEKLLYDALNLPPLSNLRPRYFDKTTDLRNYVVKLIGFSGRLDASYHVPIVDSIKRCLKQAAAEITTIGDHRISKRVILPGRFTRVYVQEGQGVPFFGGKQLYELDPGNKKYLSIAKHGDRIKRDLKLAQNMVLITRSGTIGKVALVPEHWENWIANEHIIRVEPATLDIAGYLYVFLASEYGRELIIRFTYGSVVDEIDDLHVSQVPVPLLNDAALQARINSLALEANVKRSEAYRAEQKAIRITNEEVIHASQE